MNNVRTLLIALGALLVGVSVFFLGLQAFEAQQAFKGSVIASPAPLAMDFELQRTDGSAYRLSEQTGKVVLIYLGFTNCPDVCPATLGKFALIKEELAEEADAVQFVFITVDPERDTPEVIAEYLARFDPGFVGLTGEQAELQRVWTGYGSDIPIKSEIDSELEYTVSHSAYVLVVDKQGALRLTFSQDMTAAEMTHDVRLLLKEQ